MVVFLLSIIPAVILLLAATRHWPYGVSELRWVVAVCAALLLLINRSRADRLWQVILLIVLIVFNPLVPLHVSAHAWTLLEFAGATCFIAAAFSLSS